MPTHPTLEPRINAGWRCNPALGQFLRMHAGPGLASMRPCGLRVRAGRRARIGEHRIGEFRLLSRVRRAGCAEARIAAAAEVRSAYSHVRCPIETGLFTPRRLACRSRPTTTSRSCLICAACRCACRMFASFNPSRSLRWVGSSGTPSLPSRSCASDGVFERYPHSPQNVHDIEEVPDGARVAWYEDSGGNVLSVAEVRAASPPFMRSTAAKSSGCIASRRALRSVKRSEWHIVIAHESRRCAQRDFACCERFERPRSLTVLGPLVSLLACPS